MATSINWPSTLPALLNPDGYSRGYGDNLLRTSMDIGPAKVRRRSTAQPEPMKGTVTLDATQLAAFKTFFETTLLAGSLRFNWTDPDDGTTAIEVRFTEPPAWQYLGGGSGAELWEVNLSLEVLP